MNLVKKFGKKIKLLRFKKDISQEQLSELSGISRSVMGKIERGEIATTIVSAQKIAIALNVDIRTLFDFSDLE